MTLQIFVQTVVLAVAEKTQLFFAHLRSLLTKTEDNLLQEKFNSNVCI